MKREKKSISMKSSTDVKIELPNHGNPNAGHNLYFPRLMVNKRGEIILATGRSDTHSYAPHGLTTGILVGLTPDAERTKVVGGKPVPIGTKFDDWEVAGELEDYNGEVTITLKNRV